MFSGTIFNSIDELVNSYVERDIFLTTEEKQEIRSCNMVIKDIISSGNYEILADDRILVY